MQEEIIELDCPFFERPIAVKKLHEGCYLSGNLLIWKWIDDNGEEQWCFGDYKAIMKCEF